MEFKDLLKALEEYYAKTNEAVAVRCKWFDNKVQIKSGMFEVQKVNIEAMTSLQDSIKSELGFIFSIYGDPEFYDFEMVKTNINNFITLANKWLECFEEKQGE